MVNKFKHDALLLSQTRRDDASPVAILKLLMASPVVQHMEELPMAITAALGRAPVYLLLGLMMPTGISHALSMTLPAKPLFLEV
jgi:hypothetical protein